VYIKEINLFKIYIEYTFINMTLGQVHFLYICML
jgi:hypothetical protein